MKKMIGLFVFLIFMGGQIVNAQSTQITGTVTSADDGLGMPGVSVVLKGTTIGASTDIDGRFSIEAKSSDILLISFVGMVTQEITVGEKTVINATLETESVGVDEVIVTAMGIRRSTKSLTYAVSNVSGDEAAQKSEPDMLKSIQGKIAGVHISGSTGTPGSATRITIRGSSSFLGDNQPLFVVDGIPYSNTQFNTSDQLVGGGSYSSGIATLDPNNIQSMEVLKGRSEK